MNETAIVILAGGSSSRLGVPKQLLPFGDSLLIQAIAKVAISSKPAVVVVVTGANSQAISAALNDIRVDLVYNKNWQEGMASSIVAAVAKLAELKCETENVILAVCDQPFVSKDLFVKMVEKHNITGKGIVASSYAGTVGTPALFHRKYFADLQNLKGTEGAKGLLKKLKHDLSFVDFPAGCVDIDTPEDYKNALLNIDGY